MPVKDHLHDWTQTFSGYACTSCSAVITNAEIAANLGSDPNIHHLWKKAGH